MTTFSTPRDQFAWTLLWYVQCFFFSFPTCDLRYWGNGTVTVETPLSKMVRSSPSFPVTIIANCCWILHQHWIKHFKGSLFLNNSVFHKKQWACQGVTACVLIAPAIAMNEAWDQSTCLITWRARCILMFPMCNTNEVCLNNWIISYSKQLRRLKPFLFFLKQPLITLPSRTQNCCVSSPFLFSFCYFLDRSLWLPVIYLFIYLFFSWPLIRSSASPPVAKLPFQVEPF